MRDFVFKNVTIIGLGLIGCTVCTAEYAWNKNSRGVVERMELIEWLRSWLRVIDSPLNYLP